jgi:hypothetical protein
VSTIQSIALVLVGLVGLLFTYFRRQSTPSIPPVTTSTQVAEEKKAADAVASAEVAHTRAVEDVLTQRDQADQTFTTDLETRVPELVTDPDKLDAELRETSKKMRDGGP